MKLADLKRQLWVSDLVTHPRSLLLIPGKVFKVTAWFFLAVSLVLFVFIIVPTSRMYSSNASQSVATTKHPVKFPVLFACPVSIPLSVLAGLGYGEEDLAIVRDIIPFTTDEDRLESRSTLANRSLSDTDTFQDVLKKIADKHLQMLRIDALPSIADVRFHDIFVKTVLVPSGYCFAALFEPAQNLTSQTSKHLQGEMKFHNESLEMEGNGFQLQVDYHEAELLLPVNQAYQAESVRIGVYITFRSRRETTGCYPENEPKMRRCYRECMNIVDEGKPCQIYHPLKRQQIYNLCRGISAQLALVPLLNEGSCLETCPTPCNEAVVKGFFASDVSQSRNLNVRWFYQSSDTSIHIKDERAVLFSFYAGYVGGNLGSCFGLCIFGIFMTLVDIIPKSKKIRKRLSNRIIGGATWFLVFTFFFPLALDCYLAYSDKKTGSALTLNEAETSFKLGTIDDFLDERKLMAYYEEIKSLWPEATHADIIGANAPHPNMCQFLYGLVQLDYRAVPFQDSNISRYRIKKMQEVWTELSFIKRAGVVEFLRSISLDPEEVFYNISDMKGETLPHSSKVSLSPIGVGFETQVTMNLTQFITSGGELKIYLRRNNASSSTCRQYDKLYLAVYGKDEVVSTHVLVMVLTKLGDYSISLSSQRIKLKTRPKRQCASKTEFKTGCLTDCLLRRNPCPCESIIPTTEEPLIYNVSNMCHKFMSIYHQCIVRRFYDNTILIPCEDECVIPCERLIYHSRVTARKPLNPDVQYLYINFHSGSTNINVQEFFVYNLFSMFINTGGLLELLFGYSFMSTCVNIYLVITAVASKKHNRSIVEPNLT